MYLLPTCLGMRGGSWLALREWLSGWTTLLDRGLVSLMGLLVVVEARRTVEKDAEVVAELVDATSGWEEKETLTAVLCRNVLTHLQRW